MEPAIIVHGGGWSIPRDRHRPHLEGCRAAAEVGFDALVGPGNSADAVEEAIRHMEDDPTFDAGRGSFLTREGEVEMDAMIMRGDLSMGAVASVSCIAHPVTLARRIMEDSEHCMLVSTGALDFARERGMPTVTTRSLLTERERERWMERDDDPGTVFRRRGTVGAVAIGPEGSICAATSTGGTPNKAKGRVGDSALVGCGTYADDHSAGVSATGWGESLMRVTMARRVCGHVEKGKGAMEACRDSVGELSSLVNGIGGVIAIDHRGEVGYAHNTECMAVAVHTPDGTRAMVSQDSRS
ncbi:MAG: isoaspartyl peptidase/L-asparaginase [Methanomassiliicoccales archaeon]